MISAKYSAATLLLVLTSLLSLFLSTPVHAASDSKGKEFILAFPANSIAHGNLSLFITSEEDAQGTVQIPGVSFVESFAVAANSITQIRLPTPIQDLPAMQVSQLGVNIISDQEVTVYGLNQQMFTTDAFLSLPLDTLGLEYLTLGYEGLSGYPSQITVTGIYDNTEVKINEQTITLDRNDSYLFSDAEDLTGTTVESSAPIAVLSGTPCTNIPKGYAACDHIVEMMPPVTTWGKSFLTLPLATRLRGAVFRVLASRNGTLVSINGSEIATLDRSEYYETVLEAPSQIETSEPALVAQYSPSQAFDRVPSDPFMMLVPPSEQFLDNYTFVTLGPEVGFENGFVNAIMPTTDLASLELDGAPVDVSMFEPIGQSGFSGAQLDLGPGSHRIHGTVPFGISVYGFGDFDSYGYPGGMAFDFINPHGDRFLPNLMLDQIGERIEGILSDNEDANLNGILDAGEDLNGNGIIDRRTEDRNQNGQIDDGEDTNGDGILDRDTGIFRVELGPGSSNLRLEVGEFVPGSLQARFTISLLDPGSVGAGTLLISDGAGNRIEEPITLSTVPFLTQVRVVSTLSANGIDLDASSFTRAPDRVETSADQTLIEWRFDRFSVDQLEALDYDVVLLDPKAAEMRLVTHKLELFYTDVNGSEVGTELGEQYVSVLPSIYQFDVSTGKALYSANEPVVITAELTNLSEFTTTADIKFFVSDDAGVLVAELGTLAAIRLDAGQTRSLIAPAFDTATLLEGGYEVQAELLDDAGLPLAMAAASFRIQTSTAETRLSVALSTDKPTYEPLEILTIQERIVNTTANAALDGLAAFTTVYAPDGAVFWSDQEPVRQLLPGSREESSLSVPLGQAPAGTYRVSLQVLDSQDSEQAFAETTFALLATAHSGTGLRGALSPTPDSARKNDSVSLLARLDNLGNSDVTDLPITLAVVDPQTEQIVTEWPERVASLRQGDSYLIARNWTAVGDVGSTFIAMLGVELSGEIKSLASDRISIVGGIDSELALDNRGRILVLLDPGENNNNSDDESDHEEEDKSSDDSSDSEVSDNDIAELLRDLYTPPSSSAQQDFLDQLLADTGWPYTLVSNPKHFTREMRSGGYTVYLLLSRGVKLPEQLQRELREAVYRGEGLIVAGSHQGPNNHLDAPLGVEYTGKERGAVSLSLRESPLHPEDQAVLALPEKVAHIELTGATAVGDFTLSDGAPRIAVAVNQYGAGNTVFAGLDLLAEATATGADSLPASLLLSALNYTQPAPPRTITDALAPIRLSLLNEGVATAGQTIIRLPSNIDVETQVVDTSWIAQPEGTLVWPFDLAEAASDNLTLWLRLPQIPGPIVIEAQIQTRLSPDWRDDDNLTLEMDVQRPAGLSEALADLADLSARDRVYDTAYKHLTKAHRALSEGNELKALRKLVKVTDELIKVRTPEAAAVRGAVAEAIRQVGLTLAAF